MHNPPHSGEIIKALCLEPPGVSVTEADKALCVSRKTPSAIINDRASDSREMPVRLFLVFHTSPGSRLTRQAQFELWHAEQSRKRLRVRRLAA